MKHSAFHARRNRKRKDPDIHFKEGVSFNLQSSFIVRRKVGRFGVALAWLRGHVLRGLGCACAQEGLS